MDQEVGGSGGDGEMINRRSRSGGGGVTWGKNEYMFRHLLCRYVHTPWPTAICQATGCPAQEVCTCMCGDVWCVGPNRRTDPESPLRQHLRQE